MKSVKQIRESLEILSESVESSADVRKLTTLVRAGLFDPHKLTMLKRALNKDNVKMTRAEREALLQLLDKLLDTVMSSQSTLQKVKSSIQEEEYGPSEDEINEASKVDLDINQIPPLIVMKRRAIRVFPDGQKVALYWADRINKYISVPFQSIGISEEVELDEAYFHDATEKGHIKKLQALQDAKTKGDKKAISAAQKEVDDSKARIEKTYGKKHRASIDAFHKDAENRVKSASSTAQPSTQSPASSTQATGKKKKPKDKSSNIDTYLAKKSAEKRASAGEMLRQIKNPIKSGIAAGSQISGSKTMKVGHGIGYAIGSMIRGRMIKNKIKSRALARKNKTTPTTTSSTPNTVTESKRVNLPNTVKQIRLREERFKQRLQELREARQYGTADAALDAASFIPGPAGSVASLGSAAASLSRGDYGGAALDALGALPVVGYAAKAAKLAKVAKAASAAGKASKGLKSGGKIARAMVKGRRLLRGKLGKLAAGAAGYAAGSSGSDNNSGSNSQAKEPTDFRMQRPDMGPAFRGTGVRTSNPYASSRQRQSDMNLSRQQQRESYNMIKSIAEGTEPKELVFEDGTIELSPGVAAKMVETYNALNSQNKKIVQEMINKDKNSFMKFANFASSK